MKYILALSIFLFSGVECFLPNIKHSQDNFFPFNDVDLKINNIDSVNYDHILHNSVNGNHDVIDKFTLTTSKLNIFNHECPLIEKLKHTEFLLELSNKLDEQQRIIGKKIVIEISSLLPHFDGIGHQVLHANNEFISYILSLPDISDEVKKEIILLSIKFAQYGDNFGSYLLQMYYDIVDKSL